MFSEREEKILKAIGGKKTTVKEICDKIFPTDESKPFDSEIAVTNTIRRIIEKCEYHKLDWTLNRVKDGHKYIITKEKLT